MKTVNIETAREVFIKTSLKHLLNKGESKSNLLRLFPEYSHYISVHNQESNETMFAFLENLSCPNSLELKQSA